MSQTFRTSARFCSETGWPPMRFVPRLHAHEGDVVGAIFLYDRFKFADIHIALERQVARDFETLVLDKLLDHAAIQRDMRLRGREVIVHRHDLAGLHEDLGQDVFAGAALVRRQDPVHAEQLAQLGFEPCIGRASGVAVVGHHHRGDLLIAHRVHAAVGQHVHEHVAVLQQEGVVAGLVHGLEPGFDRQQCKLLNDAHLVHFKRQGFTAEELDPRHANPLLVHFSISADEGSNLCLCYPMRD